MTEERQAELLAAWLADPEAPIPEGLDPEVVESVLALQPQRAPAPRVTAESILDLVETGPLAPTVVEPPPLEAPANRGWWKWALAGSSTLVAAALALVVVGVGVVGTTQSSFESPTPAMDAMREEGVAAIPQTQADTGLDGDAVARRPRAKPAAAPRPRPAPRPAARPASRPQLALDRIPEAAAPAEAEQPDAVAFAEDDGDDDFVDGIEAEPSADLDAEAASAPRGGGGLSVASGSTQGASPTPVVGDQAAKQEPARSQTAGDGFASESQRQLTEEDERREAAEDARRNAEVAAQRAAEEAARKAAEERARRAVEQEKRMQEERAAEEARRFDRAEAAAAPVDAGPQQDRMREAAAALAKEESDDVDSAETKAKKRRPRPRRAPAAEPPPAASPAAPPPPPSDPDLRAARDFLAVGDPAAALNAVARGLKRHPTDSRIRQQLFQVRGQAYTALGQAEAAAEAYREAEAIGTRL